MLTDITLGKEDMWNWGPRFISVWNFAEASPLFTDEDRKIIVNMLYRVYSSNYTDNYLSKMADRGVRFNHESIPRVSLYFAAKYFDKYFDLPFISYWMERANKTFQNNTSYISLDEGADYIFHVPCSELDYKMAGGGIDFLEKGLKDVADLFVMFIDNLGIMASAGDTYPYGHSSAFSWGHSTLMYFASWYFNDPLYIGILDKVKNSRIIQEKPDLDNLFHRYYTPITGKLPEGYPGDKCILDGQGYL